VAADRPFCLCLAGPNGSGKSTFAARLRFSFSLRYWIDPDQIARTIADRRGEASITDAVSRDAFNQARNTRCAYASRSDDFGFETVFSHGSNLAFLRALKAIGYEIHLYYVSTDDVEINVTRVRNRVAAGGHAVPEQKVRERYARSALLLSLAVRDCDRVVLYDNSRPLTIVGSSEEAGRLAGEINNDLSRGPRRQLSLFPPRPAWVLKYALFPYAVTWPKSKLFESAADAFGDDIHFTQGADLRDPQSRHRFFQQFAF
jgi:predicted ABC-type ATPase